MGDNKLGVLKTTGAMNMNEINEEIKLTLNLMQSNNCEGTLKELQKHLSGLLEIKRNEYKQRLAERSWSEPVPVTHDKAPYKSVKLDGQIADEAKPLTAEELGVGDWWCADVSEECRLALIDNGIDARAAKWLSEEHCRYCYMDGSAIVRSYIEPPKTKQIHRIGNEFYWSE